MIDNVIKKIVTHYQLFENFISNYLIFGGESMSKDTTPLGKVIKKRLIDQGMTQIQLAEIVGTSPKYLSLIIRGDRTGRKYMPRIIDVLGMEGCTDEGNY